MKASILLFGTTTNMAAMLKRNSVGYKIDLELLETVREKMGLKCDSLFQRDYEVEIIVRDDAKHLRTRLQNLINTQKLVTQETKHQQTSGLSIKPNCGIG